MRRLRKLKELSVLKKITLIFSFVVMIMGLVSATYLTLSIINSSNNTSIAIVPPLGSTKKAPPNSISGNPKFLEIPSLEIALPIIDGAFDLKTESWTLTEDKAQFANETSLPNNKSGKTFIYGHANKKVFADLNKIKGGETAYIKTDNGHIFKYQFQNSYETSPDNLSVMKPSETPTLTIQTCSGFRYQKRLMFNFKFDAVEDIKP